MTALANWASKQSKTNEEVKKEQEQLTRRVAKQLRRSTTRREDRVAIRAALRRELGTSRRPR